MLLRSRKQMANSCCGSSGSAGEEAVDCRHTFLVSPLAPGTHDQNESYLRKSPTSLRRRPRLGEAKPCRAMQSHG